MIFKRVLAFSLLPPLLSSVFLSPFWAADPKGTMSHRTEGEFPSVRPNERPNERPNVRPVLIPSHEFDCSIIMPVCTSRLCGN